ncbi:PAS domain S-box protein, partial [Candidatus Bathyarchaeota archaeon]|nr:PAS domain S-box protein [Candidatus Bathyarchaeota archaeon]
MVDANDLLSLPLASVLENLDGGFLLFDLEGNLIFANEAILSILGEPRRAILGSKFKEYLPPRSREVLNDAIARRARGESTSYAITWTGAREKGFRLQVKGTPLDIPMKGVVGTIEMIIHALPLENETSMPGFSKDNLKGYMMIENLEELRHILQVLADHTDNFVHLVNRDLEILLYNKMVGDLTRELGFKGDILGTPLQMVFPFLSKRVLDETRMMFTTGLPTFQEDSIIIGGEIFNVETSRYPIKGEKEVKYVLTVIHDIRALRKTERELRISERRFKNLFDTVPVGIIMTDLDEKIVEVNAACATMTGFSEIELTGMKLADLTLREDLDRERKIVKAALEDNGYSGLFKKHCIRKDGSTFLVQAQCWIITDSHGDPVGTWQIIMDITERELARKQLEESEQRYKQIVDSIPVGLLFINENVDGTLQLAGANPAADQILGIDNSRFLGYPVREAFPGFSNPNLHTHLLDVARTGTPWSHGAVNYKSKTLKGTFLVQVYRPTIGNLVLAFIDVTETRSIEKERRMILDTIPDPVMLYDVPGLRLRWINQAGREEFNVEQKELIGMRCKELWGFQGVENESWLLKMSIQSGENQEKELKTGDGRKWWIRASLITDHLNQVTGGIQVAIDITELRKKEQAIIEQERLYRSLFEQSNDAIFIHDLHGVIKEVNDRAASWIGVPKKRLPGMKLHDIIASDVTETVNQMLIDIEREGYGRNEALLKSRESNEILVEISSKVIDGDATIVQSIARDMTGRDLAIRAIMRERDRATLYLDTAAVIMLALDKDGRITLINKRACSILEIDQLEALNKPWIDTFIPEEDRKKVWKLFRGIISGSVQELGVVENKIITATGKRRLVRWWNTTIKDEEGAIVGTLSSGRDITEQYRTKNALKESEERFRSTFDHAPVGIAHVARDKHWILVNSKFLEILGYSEEEIQTLTFIDISHPDDRLNSVQLFEEVLSGEREGYEIEKRYMHKDGHVIWVQVTVSAVHERDGSIKYLIVVMEDVTARRKVRQSLIESEARYRSLIEDQSEFIVRWKPDGTRTFVNASVCRYLGKSREELIGKSLFELIHDGDIMRFKHNLTELTPEHPSVTAEYRLLLPSGEEVWHEWTDRAIFEKGGEILEYHSVGRDITKQKNYEMKLEYKANFETVLAAMSSIFIQVPPKDIYDATYYVAWMIGMFIGADRCSIVHESNTPGILDFIASWNRQEMEGIPRHTNNHRDEPDFHDFKWKLKWIKNGGTLKVNNANEMEPELEEIKGDLERNNIKSILVVPVIMENNLIGFISVETVGGIKEWNEDDMLLLRIAGEVVSNTIKRWFQQLEIQNRLILEDMVARLSTNFINMAPNDIDEGIRTALENIGEHLNADLVLLMDVTETNKTRVMNEWHKSNIPDIVGTVYDYKMDDLPSSCEEISRFEGATVLEIPDTSLMTRKIPGLKEELLSHNIKSLFCILIEAREFYPIVLALVTLDTKLRWTRETRKMLVLAAQMLYNGLVKRKNVQELMESEERYRYLIENSPDFIFLLNSNGEIVDFNERVINKTKLNRKDLQHASLFDLGTFMQLDVNSFKELSPRTHDGKLVRTFQMRFFPDDQEEMWLEATLSRIWLKREQLYFIIARDVTKQKNAQQLVIEELEKLKELDTMRNQFIYRVSHELKTPLSAVISA